MEGDECAPVTQTQNLFIGSGAAARDGALLSTLGITAIVNCTADLENTFEKDSSPRNYLRCAVEDDTSASLIPYFGPADAFIAEHLAKGGKVLVHCRQGISRSATIVLAHLLHESSRALASGAEAPLNLVTACLQVKRARAVARPNVAFFEELIELEAKLLAANDASYCAHHGIVRDAEDFRARSQSLRDNLFGDGFMSEEPDVEMLAKPLTGPPWRDDAARANAPPQCQWCVVM